MTHTTSDRYRPYVDAVEASLFRITNAIKQTRAESASLVNIETNIPFFTQSYLNGDPVWAVYLETGPLPSQTPKMITIPTSVKNQQKTGTLSWVDLGGSFLYTQEGLVVPLPVAQSTNGKKSNGKLDTVATIYSDGDFVIIETIEDMSNYNAIVTLKYRTMG